MHACMYTLDEESDNIMTQGHMGPSVSEIRIRSVLTINGTCASHTDLVSKSETAPAASQIRTDMNLELCVEARIICSLEEILPLDGKHF